MKPLEIVITGVVIVVLLIVALGLRDNGVSHNDGSNQEVASVPSGGETTSTLAENLPNQAIPGPSENGLYDHVTTDFVVKLIQDNWTKIHQQSDDRSNDLQFGRIYYVDPKDAKNKLWIQCYASLNDNQEGNNNDVDLLQRNG